MRKVYINCRLSVYSPLLVLRDPKGAVPIEQPVKR